MRQRRRDGSGRGASLSPATGANIWGPLTTAVLARAPGVNGPADAPAVDSRTHAVAVVAHQEDCILCETCFDVCPCGAITLRETAEVDAASCTGCGACENACPTGVLALIAA